MQKHKMIFFILTITLVIFGCQKPVKKFNATQFDPSSKNFSFLDKALKDVKILALGESSHGFGSLHTLKVEMVKYLHENSGYDLLILEAGYADIGISWYNHDKSDSTQMINSMMPRNMRSEQMLGLFKYLKEKKESKKPLEIRGMDTRITGQAFDYRLMYVIRRLEPKIIQDSIENGLEDVNYMLDSNDNEEEWIKYRASYLNAIDMAKSILIDSKEDIGELELAEEKEIEILLKYLDMLVELIDYDFGEQYTRGLGLRDSLMAENVASFLSEFPKTKVIIWGHNGHIEKGPGEGDKIKWAGHYLKERYGDDYYSMGMYAKKGYIYQTQEKKTSNFDIASLSFIEGKIDADYGKNVFIDLPKYDETNTSWVNKLINGYELEAGGQVRFVPTKRFDGVLLLGETEAPKFLSNKGRERR